MEVINARNIAFSYGKEAIFKDINFSIFEKDYVAVIGSNGTGKSTLFKLLIKDLTNYSGEILLFGENIQKFRQWNLVGYLPQLNILAGNSFPATVEEIVTANLYYEIGLFKFPKKEHKEKVYNSLKTVGMEEYKNRLIGNLSGGQQQKVMLARALVSSPKILLLDEPTAGVDSSSSAELYELFAKLNRETNITIITITHDLGTMFKDFNRVLFLENSFIHELTFDEITRLQTQPILSRGR